MAERGIKSPPLPSVPHNLQTPPLGARFPSKMEARAKQSQQPRLCGASSACCKHCQPPAPQLCPTAAPSPPPPSTQRCPSPPKRSQLFLTLFPWVPNVLCGAPVSAPRDCGAQENPPGVTGGVQPPSCCSGPPPAAASSLLRASRAHWAPRRGGVRRCGRWRFM